MSNFQKFALIPYKDYIKLGGDDTLSQSEDLRLQHYVNYVGSRMKLKATQLLSQLRDHNISVETSGELQIEGKKLDHTNFIDILKYLVNTSPTTLKVPRGIEDLLAYLRKKNFPESLIPNVKARSHFHDQPLDLTPHLKDKSTWLTF
jgi:hypothetical protein